MGASTRRLTLVLAASLLAGLPGQAGAAEPRVPSTVALRETWHDLKARFESGGHRLTIVLDTSGAAARRVAEGEAVDVVVTTDAGLDRLVAAG